MPSRPGPLRALLHDRSPVNAIEVSRFARSAGDSPEPGTAIWAKRALRQAGHERQTVLGAMAALTTAPQKQAWEDGQYS